MMIRWSDGSRAEKVTNARGLGAWRSSNSGICLSTDLSLALDARRAGRGSS